MKKMLLAAAASVAVLTSSAFAMVDNPCYLKVEGGAAVFHKIKETGSLNGVTLTTVKLKSNTSPILGAGVGFYVMDNVRTELTLDVLLNSRLKKNIAIAPGVAVDVKHKARIGSLLLSGYVDFYDVGGFKLYAGAGVGAAQVRETVSHNPVIAGNVINVSVKTKRTYNFAYQLGAGASATVADGVNLDIGYSWRDYGKTKSKTQGNTIVGKTRYKGHNVIAGLRFDI